MAFLMGACVEIPGDVSRICGIIAHELARIHVSYYNDDAKRTKGMYRQRIQKAWGHTAHRGCARLILDRTRYLIIHGTAHRGANGAAMPTDEDHHDGNFLFTPPEETEHGTRPGGRGPGGRPRGCGFEEQGGHVV